jgi:hypothetical protein
MSDQPQPNNLVPVECAALPQPNFTPPNPLLEEYQSALADKQRSRVYPEQFTLGGKDYERTTVFTAGTSYTSLKYPDGRIAIANNTTDQVDYYNSVTDGKSRMELNWQSTEVDGKVKQFRAFFNERGQLYSEHVSLFNSSSDFLADPSKPLIDAAYNFEDGKTSFCGEVSPTGIKRVLYPKDSD